MLSELASDRTCGFWLGREYTLAATMTLKNGLEKALALRRPAFGHLQNECAEWVGGAFLGSDSRRACGNSFGREHTSAATMTLMMGLDTLWCYGWEVSSWLVYAKTGDPFQLDVYVVLRSMNMIVLYNNTDGRDGWVDAL